MNNSAAKVSAQSIQPLRREDVTTNITSTYRVTNYEEKVGEIFTEAGAAFNKLAELTMQLHPMAETSPSNVQKTPVKRKMVDERSVSATPTSHHTTHPAPISQQVTLNMLNAQESETDGDLGSNVKLEFESSTEEVTT